MPLHIFYGANTFARNEGFRELRESLDTDGSLATNTTWLDARQSSPQEVMSACDTLPFLGNLRLVVLEGALQSAKKPKRGRKKQIEDVGDETEISPWPVLVEYIDRMPPSTTLVFLDGAVPASDFLRSLKHKGSAESFPVPNEKELPGWIALRAKVVELKIDPSAVRLLAELVGPDMWALANELDKLKAFANGDTVREIDVRALVSRAKEHKGWDLADAVIEGRGASAAKIFYELVEDGQVPQVSLSNVAGRYRRIAIVKDMIDRGESNGAIALRLDTKPGYGVDKLIDQARRHDWAAIRRAYARLIQAETDGKGGLVDYPLAVELAIQELAMGLAHAQSARGLGLRQRETTKP